MILNAIKNMFKTKTVNNAFTKTKDKICFDGKCQVLAKTCIKELTEKELELLSEYNKLSDDDCKQANEMIPKVDVIINKIVNYIKKFDIDLYNEILEKCGFTSFIFDFVVQEFDLIKHHKDCEQLANRCLQQCLTEKDKALIVEWHDTNREIFEKDKIRVEAFDNLSDKIERNAFNLDYNLSSEIAWSDCFGDGFIKFIDVYMYPICKQCRN